jgi:hypothetical protein
MTQNERAANESILAGLAGVIGRVDGFGPPSSAGFYPQLADVIRGRESYLKLSNLVKRGTFQEVSHFNSEGVFWGDVEHDHLDEVAINPAGIKVA